MIIVKTSLCYQNKAFVAADAFFGAGGELVDDVVETKIFVNLLQQRGEGRDFRLNLVFGAKNVPVILRESAHAHDAVQAAGRLVAVASAEFAIAQRQIAVAFHALFENQDVAEAVHGLERVIALFAFGSEHVFPVFVPVPCFFPERFIHSLDRKSVV